MPIAENIYGDNDADVDVLDLPTGLTVEWFIAAMPDGAIPTPATVAIHADVSGTCTESGTKPTHLADDETSTTGRYYFDVLEGSAITERLLPAYVNQVVALIVKHGQDLRVYGTTTVRPGRLIA